jgi:hypothetical protein
MVVVNDPEDLRESSTIGVRRGNISGRHVFRLPSRFRGGIGVRCDSRRTIRDRRDRHSDESGRVNLIRKIQLAGEEG